MGVDLATAADAGVAAAFDAGSECLVTATWFKLLGSPASAVVRTFLSPYRGGDIDGSAVRTGDLKLIFRAPDVSALRVPPAAGDFVVCDGSCERLEVVAARQFALGRLWKVQARPAAPCLVATAVLDFPATEDGAWADLTISAPGAAVRDVMGLGLPDSVVIPLTAFGAWVSGDGVVAVRFSNYSGGSINLPAATFSVKVFK